MTADAREKDVLSRFSGRLIPERDFADAYETTPAVLRALCKQAIAAQHTLFGEAPEKEEFFFARCAQGMHMRRRILPADWAFFAFDADYVSAPRLAAALMPALLARVPLTPVVCLGGRPRPELLCALELAGLDQAYALDADQGREVLRELDAAGRGRVVLLHRGRLDALGAAARAAGIPCLEERRPPVLRIDGGGVDVELVRLAHPDAVFAPAGAPADAAYRSGEKAAPFAERLTLLAGMEGCWTHPGLEPDFFRVHGLLLAPCACDREGGAQ